MVIGTKQRLNYLLLDGTYQSGLMIQLLIEVRQVIIDSNISRHDHMVSKNSPKIDLKQIT